MAQSPVTRVLGSHKRRVPSVGCSDDGHGPLSVAGKVEFAGVFETGRRIIAGYNQGTTWRQSLQVLLPLPVIRVARHRLVRNPLDHKVTLAPLSRVAGTGCGGRAGRGGAREIGLCQSD